MQTGVNDESGAVAGGAGAAAGVGVEAVSGGEGREQALPPKTHAWLLLRPRDVVSPS